MMSSSLHLFIIIHFEIIYIILYFPCLLYSNIIAGFIFFFTYLKIGVAFDNC